MSIGTAPTPAPSRATSPRRRRALRCRLTGRTAFQRAVDPEHQRAVGHESAQQRAQQRPQEEATRRARAPGNAIQHPVEVHKVSVAGVADEARHAGDGARAGGEDRAEQQRLGLASGRVVEEAREG